MICSVAIHEQSPASIASDEARSIREWIKEQPGFGGGYHAQDSQTLKSVSITVWDPKDSMMALRDHTGPPGGDHNGLARDIRCGGGILGRVPSIHRIADKVSLLGSRRRASGSGIMLIGGKGQ